MSEKFERACKIVLGIEGGYSNNPKDRGGETNYGVTIGTFRKAQRLGWIPKDITIRELTVEQAKKIYKLGYWDPLHLDEMPEPLYLLLFDCAINNGVGGAVKFLQESLNSILKNVNLKVDGVLGPKTKAALDLFLKLVKEVQHPELEDAFLFRYLCVDLMTNRLELYAYLVEKYPEQKVFLWGWVRQRIINLAKKAKLEN